MLSGQMSLLMAQVRIAKVGLEHLQLTEIWKC